MLQFPKIFGGEKVRYAIDRYQPGCEKEVCADEFYGKFIPLRKSRFYCPECGEIVYLRQRGGSHPDQFFHMRKTETTPECDKRVDGSSELYLYERVGLPVFLTRKGFNFVLNIGFPAISEKLLDYATQSNTYLTISGANRSRTVYVNQMNFYSDSMTMVPVDFVPSVEKNYSIKIVSSCSDKLQKKWSNYADGFSFSGAIFTYSETGGKKIRRGDSVSLDCEYYLVTPEKFTTVYSSIKTEYVGKLQLNSLVYNVYTMIIKISITDTQEYNSVSRYLKNQFGVWLISTPPELIPLWPPVVSQDVLIPALDSSNLYCSVSSGNDSPNVYSYSKNNVIKVPVSEDEHGSKTIFVSLGSLTATLSVDRQYVGREITIARKNIEKPVFSYDFSFETKNGTHISFDCVTTKDLSNDLLVKSNAKFELYVGSTDKTYQHISIRNTEDELPCRRGSVEIMVTVENGIVKQHFCQSSLPKMLDERILIADFEKASVGECVTAPLWINEVIDRCRSKKYSKLMFSIIQLIHNGKLPIGALRYLSKIKHTL